MYFVVVEVVVVVVVVVAVVAVVVVATTIDEAAWDKAEEASWLSGNPFNDRHGNRCNIDCEKIGVVEIVLRRWCEGAGIDYVLGQVGRKVRAT